MTESTTRQSHERNKDGIGVVLTGCGILIAMAGLFGWFAIQEKASAQPECHVLKETGQTVPSLLGGRLSQKQAKVERFRSSKKERVRRDEPVTRLDVSCH